MIASIFSDRNEAQAFEYLSGCDAQAFVDIIYEASIFVLLLLHVGRSVPTKASVPVG